MSLELLDVEIPPTPFSAIASRLIETSDRYWDDFVDTKRNKRLPRFIPSDPAFLYSALAYISKHHLASGDVFLEWGSGFGVSACLAAQMGFRSFGIEIEEELVEVSNKLAREFDLPVPFLAESYLPDGYNSYNAIGGCSLMRPPRSRRYQPIQYEGMDLDVDEIDVFYVYPWPDEQEMILDLFDAIAGEEALLIAYFGHGDINLYRKKWDED